MKIKNAIKNINNIDIQASITMHKDAHHMLLRNKQSHKIQKRSPMKIPENNILEDSSENTNYKNSSLIELFYT